MTGTENIYQLKDALKERIDFITDRTALKEIDKHISQILVETGLYKQGSKEKVQAYRKAKEAMQEYYWDIRQTNVSTSNRIQGWFAIIPEQGPYDVNLLKEERDQLDEYSEWHKDACAVLDELIEALSK